MANNNNKTKSSFITRALLKTAGFAATLPAHLIIKTVEACGDNMTSGSQAAERTAEVTVGAAIGAGHYVKQVTEDQVKQAKKKIADKSIELAEFLNK